MFDLPTLGLSAVLALGLFALALALAAAFTTTEPDVTDEEVAHRWDEAGRFAAIAAVLLVLFRLML